MCTGQLWFTGQFRLGPENHTCHPPTAAHAARPNRLQNLMDTSALGPQHQSMEGVLHADIPAITFQAHHSLLTCRFWWQTNMWIVKRWFLRMLIPGVYMIKHSNHFVPSFHKPCFILATASIRLSSAHDRVQIFKLIASCCTACHTLSAPQQVHSGLHLHVSHASHSRVIDYKWTHDGLGAT
jgi:hypothetical protein